MRRLLFNPLAQQPYAIGEYNHVSEVFVLDKNLERKQVYYLKIISGVYSYGPSILDFRNEEDFSVSNIAILDASGDPNCYAIYCEAGSNIINISNINVSLEPNKQYSIYAYQSM